MGQVEDFVLVDFLNLVCLVYKFTSVGLLCERQLDILALVRRIRQCCESCFVLRLGCPNTFTNH
jgi:hypothetical protein